MSTDDRLAAMERQLQYLIDRQDILDCLTRTSRGNDLKGSGYLKGSRDRSDPAYQRPLTLDGGERW